MCDKKHSSIAMVDMLQLIQLSQQNAANHLCHIINGRWSKHSTPTVKVMLSFTSRSVTVFSNDISLSKVDNTHSTCILTVKTLHDQTKKQVYQEIDGCITCMSTVTVHDKNKAQQLVHSAHTINTILNGIESVTGTAVFGKLIKTATPNR